MGKLSGVLIILGCMLLVVGLTLVAAGLSQHQDDSIMGAGVCALSFGALSCAAGIYLKARTLQAAAPVSSNAKSQSKQVRGGCELCGTETPAVLCRVHQLHLCPACLARHYDTRSCVYVPSTRRPLGAKAARA
jgi:hypothetical protein